MNIKMNHLFYQIDMFGGSDLSFPDDDRNTLLI